MYEILWNISIFNYVRDFYEPLICLIKYDNLWSFVFFIFYFISFIGFKIQAIQLFSFVSVTKG